MQSFTFFYFEAEMAGHGDVLPTDGEAEPTVKGERKILTQTLLCLSPVFMYFNKCQ
jgi:hypothetical protein